MSGDSDSLQFINSDTNNLDSSDEVIELDSEDAESDHNGSVICAKDGTDVTGSESHGHGSKPGLDDLVEDTPDAKCMTSNICLVSEDSLVSKCQDQGSKPGLDDLVEDTPDAKCMTSNICLVSEDSLVSKCQDQGSKPGLDDLVEDTPDAKCMPSNNCLVSEDSLVSKCAYNTEGTKGNGSAAELATSTESSLESGQKDTPALSMKNGENVPSLESQGHEPAGPGLGEDKPAQECLMSNNGLAVEGSLESRDGSNVPGKEGHDSTKKMAASNRSSLDNKKSKENSEKKPRSGSDDAKRKSKSKNIEKKDESRGKNIEKKDESRSKNIEKKDESRSKNIEKKDESRGKNIEKKDESRSKNIEKKDESRSKNIEKKDESRCDKRNSKKRSQSRDRKGSGAKSGRSNRSPGKKDGDNSRTKRNRSGSRHREDDIRKRRKVSKSRSRSRRRDNRSRTRDSIDHEREKTRQVSDILQSQIDRLKEEVEKARADLKRSSRRSRSRSSEQRDRLHSDWHSSTRTVDQRSNPFHYRSRSRSLDRLEPSDSVSQRSALPSVQRFLDASYTNNSEEKQVVVVKKVDVQDQNVRYTVLTKFKRYGEVLDSTFDKANKAATFHYKSPACAQEAVKGMNKRYFHGEYLKVVLVNERDAELAIAENCSDCGKGHSPYECPKLKRRSHSRTRELPARSSSLELHWPAQPRHPSTNLFDRTRPLSPLSLLMATESLRDGGDRPVVFRPKALPTSLTRTSADLPLGPERLAKREMTMKKMNSTVKCDWGERSLGDFEVLATVGKGTYGQMYKAADKDMKLLMALKKVTVESDKSGFPVSALQEMKLLSRLDHPNIVKLVEILHEDQENFVGAKKRGTFYFVYDYMNHDLKRLLQSKLLQLKSEDVAWFIKQLLGALSYCHRFGLVHRDVRPSNILINNRGELKLAQFGLASLYDEKAEPPTSSSLASTEQRMVSLWYRAPELLLGEKKSSPATDIWSCGCVIGEIFSRKPVFLGSDEQHQIEVISKVCGTPNTSNWPDVAVLPLHYILKNVEDYPRLFHDAFHYVPYMARSLLDQLLVMDPAKRLTAESALDTDWLKDADFPKMLPMMLVNINDCHMLMPAKSPIDSNVHCLPGVGKASSVSVEERKLEGFAGNKFVTRTRKEDVSDKVAITRSFGSTSVHESDTVWKPLRSGAGRGTTGLSVADIQVSREPAEKPYPVSSQPSRRAFNPRVMDYSCQPTYGKPESLPEKPVQHPGSLSVRSANIDSRTNLATEKSLRYEDLPQGMRPPGEGMKAHTDRVSSSLESRPAALPSSTKPAAQASDDRTFSADLERLRMLKKKLEMVGAEKRDPRASLAKAGGVADNWEVPPARKGNLGQSAEFGVDRFKRSADVGNTAISGQPPVEKTTSLRGEPEANASRGNVEAGYRSQQQSAVGPQSWPSESSAFGGGWEGPYNKTRDEGNPLPLHEPKFSAKRNEDGAANMVERPTMAPGRVPVTYADPTVNRLHRPYAATSEYDNSKPYDDSSGFSGGWGVHQQPEARPPYNRKPLPSQMNPEVRGPASAAQAWDESFSYPENTAEQRWEYDQEMAGHSSGYPGRGFSESAPYPDERWSADNRWNEAMRPPPGPFYKESDVEWRAPQSRF